MSYNGAAIETVRSAEDVATLGTILGVWAHADDEAYLSGGLMAIGRELGLRVVCVTATRGEQGTPDPTTWPPARLAATRMAELAVCLDLLGVVEHHWLDYPDGGCSGVPTAQAVDRLARIIGDTRPDTVLTFGPDGITGHPDHVTVGAWTSAACAIAAPGARLLHATVAESWLNRWAGHHAELGIYAPGHPVPTPDADLAIDLRCDDPIVGRKVDALAAQQTQTTSLIEHMGRQRYTEWVRSEYYVDRSL